MIFVIYCTIRRDLLSGVSSDGDLVDKQLYSVGPISHFGECMAVNRVMVDNTLNVTHIRLFAVRIKYISTCTNTKFYIQINNVIV